MKNSKNTNKIITEIEALLAELKRELNMSSRLSSPDRVRRGRTFLGLTGEIHELIEDGFFDEPKIIGEVQKKLKDKGTKKPTTALMPSLIHLVRKKVLDRSKPNKGQYKYIKK